MSITTVQRQDKSLYLEGLTQGQAIWLELGQRTWVLDGVTATIHSLNQAGQVQIPVFKTGDIKGLTELCEDGDGNKANYEFRTLNLDKKVSGVFNGCFTVANIADPNITSMLDQATIRQMALAYTTGIENELVANAQAGTISDTNATNFEILMDLQKKFFDENRIQPSAVLVSARAYKEIAKEHGFIPTASGSTILTTGNVGIYAGLQIIQTNITDTDLIMISPESVHIAIAGSPEQANQSGSLSAGFDIFNQMNGFSAGIVSKLDNMAQNVATKTWVHIPLGIKIIPELAYKITLSSINVPDVVSFGAATTRTTKASK